MVTSRKKDLNPAKPRGVKILILKDKRKENRREKKSLEYLLIIQKDANGIKQLPFTEFFIEIIRL